jgi:hypothetical protein
MAHLTIRPRVNHAVIRLLGSAFLALAGVATIATAGGLPVPLAHADNKRLNDSVVLDVYTIQQRAGCTSAVTSDPQLELAAKWHTYDVLTNRNLVSAAVSRRHHRIDWRMTA